MKKIGNATLYCADCKDVLPLLKDIDACVTDPPYGLSFMGKQWDYDVPDVDIWTQVHDALKPGAHLLSFFGSRTYHRGAIPIEDAGFEIRDQLMWLYGSGFPKSHNIGKAVDKLQGNEREVVGVLENEKDFRDLGKNTKEIHGLDKLGVGVSASRKSIDVTKGNSEYEGWGTALKPAHEPIVMARKPFKGTVANNVLEHGTGGINIDGCRVETNEKITNHSRGKESAISKGKYGDSKAQETHQTEGQTLGRFPANVMHDGSDGVQDIFGDKSRYFYCAKASKQDRGDDNAHPTVKPTELMKYLCRLVTPKGGVVLDPFMGSGSTGKAAVMSGFKFVGIEMDEDYFEIACARMEAAHKQKSQEIKGLF
jgi:site-specific DNA-methyltransferase (adenine-specific)